MSRAKNSRFYFLLSRFFIFVLIFTWIFSGFPQIWREPPFPPEVKEARAAAFSNGYSFRRLIDITDAQVSAGPHTNFPVLASTTLADLRTTANGGDVTDAQGDDIIFTDSDGTTQLAHEIERYTATTGELVAWVRVPSLAATSQIYMYYGNSAVTTFQGNVTSNGVTGVWDANYKGVWHLKEDPSGTAPQMKDSTSNVYHGTTGGTMTSADQVAGQVDGSLKFDGANDWVDFPDAQQTIPNGSPFTISSWVYAGTSATDEYNHVLFGRTSNGVSKYAYGIATNQSSAGTDFRGTVSNGTSAQSAACPSVSINTWTHLVVVLNGNQLTCFKNGVAGTPVTITLSGTYPQVPSTYDYGESMARSYAGSAFLAGTFDEVRVSNSARSAGWILTQYNNQSSPSGFYAIGAEETMPAFNQSAYRLFNNLDSTDVGDPLTNYSNGYSFRRLIDITDAQVSAGPHTNFPVLASTTLADLRTTANGGDVTDAQGDDIIFTDSDGTTQFAHEVEKYATTTGEFVAWVRVPSLASTSALYMYYGNSSVTTFQGNVTSNGVTGVWDANFKGVWHLNQSFSDSTSYGNNGTNNGTTDVAGKIASGRDFEASTPSQYISVADSVSLHISSQITVEAWVNPETTSAWRTMVSKMTGTTEDLYFVMYAGDLYIGLAGTGSDWNSGVALSTGVWQHVAVTYDGSYIRMYKNGALGNSVAKTGTLGLGSNTNPLYIGYNTGWPGELWDGQLDEVGISSTARSAGWISTEYNNQNSPSGFYTVGAETVKQDTAATLGSAGAAFRLRMLLHISDAQLGLSGQNFKLQFAQQSGTCDTAFSGETYADVTATTVIAYNNNATPADGDNLTANANDPTHGSDTIVNQDYEELNNFTNSVAAIPSGQDGKWDFSLKDNSAPASTAYCFRAVKSDATVLDTYTVIPQITTAAAVATVSCSTNVSSTSFGTLTTASVFTASPNASTTMSCSNTTLGCTLYVKDAGGGGNPGLWNATSSSLIASPNGTSTLQGGVVEGYGIQATTTSPGLTIGIRYNQTGNTVGGLSLSDLTLASSTADISNAEAIVTHKAAITALTLSGIYEDTITYSCTVNL